MTERVGLHFRRLAQVMVTTGHNDFIQCLYRREVFCGEHDMAGRNLIRDRGGDGAHVRIEQNRTMSIVQINGPCVEGVED